MQRKKILLGLMLSLFFVPFVLNAAEPVQLHEETARSISFIVDVPEPVFIPVGDASGVTCSIEGFSLNNGHGMPGVVQRGVMAAIPPGSRVEMTIAVYSSQDFKNIDLAPVPTVAADSFISGGEDAFLYTKDQIIYSQDEYFPSQTAEIAYTGTLRDMPFVQVLIKPVQYNPVQRIVRVVRSMTVTLFFHDFDTEMNARLMLPDSRPAPVGRVFDSIRTSSIINPGSDLKDMMRGQHSSPAIISSPADLQSSPFAIKIVTSGPGIHRVRYEDIAGLGVDLSGLTNSNLEIQNSGQEIALYRSGTAQFESGDYILFYAEDFQSKYSSTNVYWLYQGSGSGLTMQTLGSAPDSGFPQPVSFNTAISFEQNLTWRRNLPAYLDGEDEWFWKKLDVFNVNEFDIDFTLQDFVTDGNPLEFEVYLRGLTPAYHQTQFVLNGTQIGDVEWNGIVIERSILIDISPSLLNMGSNTLKIMVKTAAGNDPTTPDQYYLNRAGLTYDRSYIADNNRLAFGGDMLGGTTFELNGFSDPAIMVFDVSQPQVPVLLTGTSVSTIDGTSSVQFEKSVESDTALYAVTPDSALAPDMFIVDTPSDLLANRTDIDYIIITHAQFASTVEDLKTIREQGGLGVEIVDVQDIYDEFSYGIKDVTAIKAFLRHAYFNWHATDHPTYVALVGDATYDYRDNLGLASTGKADLVPTYLGYRGSLGLSVGATASDNWFVCVDGDDPLPDMVIGRLCVKNDQDLQNIIDKIETYENALPEEWNSRVIFAADNDDQNRFEYISESLLEITPARYTDLTLFLSEYGTDIATATDDLVSAISDGALVTNYIGHGSSDTWSKSRWFQTPNQNTGLTRDDVSLLTNTNQYTFLMILNCLSGTFSELNDDYCIAEEFMRQKQRGAAFCVAPSASGYASDHDLLGSTMYEKLFQGNIATAGVLLTVSKIDAYQHGLSRDILETFTFFGDPALELKVVPECEIDADCPDGVCFDNICVECEIDGDCPDSVCLDNICVECADDGDCPDSVCSDNICVECADDGDCPDSVCSDNICVECAVDGDCPDSVCSDNICVGCADDGDCPDGVCLDNICVECAVDGDCPDGVCLENICGECAVDGDCPDGVCSDAICGECADDGDCPDGVCSDAICVECADDGDCPDGVCSDNICVECADDDGCARGMCISNVCVVEGSVLIDKCKVNAGNNGKGDRIKFKGLLDASAADFNAAWGGDVIVIIEANGIPDLNATTFSFPIEEEYLKKGKYKAPKIKSEDKSDPKTSLQIDTIKGKIKFSAKNVDLTGLSCPITVTITIGIYVAEIVLHEDIVNGYKKPCPPELMVEF